MPPPQKVRLGDLLIEQGLLSDAQLKMALEEQKLTGRKLGRIEMCIRDSAHPLRLKILCVLGDQEVCVQEIVDAVGTSQSNISQHLAILRDKGVLLTRKDANRVYYRVGDSLSLIHI